MASDHMPKLRRGAIRAVVVIRGWCPSLLAVLALAFVAAPAYGGSPGKALGLVVLPTPAVVPAPKPTPLPVVAPDDEHGTPTDTAAADEAAWQVYLAEARPQPRAWRAIRRANCRATASSLRKRRMVALPARK